MSDTAAKLRMQAAAKRLRRAGDCGSAPGSIAEAVNEYRAACYAYYSGRWLTPTRKERRAVKRAKRVLTYPPSAAAEHRAAAFVALDRAATFRGLLFIHHGQTRLELRNARTLNTAAKHNGFYLP